MFYKFCEEIAFYSCKALELCVILEILLYWGLENFSQTARLDMIVDPLVCNIAEKVVAVVPGVVLPASVFVFCTEAA